MIIYKRHIHFPSGPINFMNSSMKDEAFAGDLGSQLLWFKSEWNEYVDALCYDHDLSHVISEALDVICCIARFPAISNSAREFLEFEEPSYSTALMMHIKNANNDAIFENRKVGDGESGKTYYDLWAEKQKSRNRQPLDYRLIHNVGLSFLQTVIDDHMFNESDDSKYNLKGLLKENEVLNARIKQFETFILSLNQKITL